MSFAAKHRSYIRSTRNGSDFGFNVKTLAKLAPVLSFLYEDWWHVDLQGLKHLPKKGPALIIANAGGVLPWAGLMMLHALIHDDQPRRLTILTDLDWIEDERVYSTAREIGLMSWSADNAKRLFAADETVVVFPEGIQGSVKPFGERYRPRAFDWTILMPAVEAHVPIIPLATIGPEESFPVGMNIEWLAKLLSLPAFPVTAAFPWLPFPANVFSLPVQWKMRLMKPCDYKKPASREEVEEICKTLALFAEGEVQAELNRLLRTRVKALF